MSAAGPGARTDPDRVGPYRVIHRLGFGGMGLVYLAVDDQGRAVAVKVLNERLAADSDARARLAREAQTLRRVRHPRIAEVVDVQVEAAVPYLVTRYIPGRPLEDEVARLGPLPLPQVKALGVQLAEALEAIHEAGVVHRDVKPGNVLLVDGAPVLIDFGIAHLVDETRLTMTGMVMGTPGYLAPEAVAGQALTPASDWWGWGATLAFAASGRAPFGTGPIEVVLDRVRRADADLSAVDDDLRPAIEAALVTDPAQRGRPPGLVERLTAGRDRGSSAPGTPPASAEDPAPAEQSAPAEQPAPTEVVRLPATRVVDVDDRPTDRVPPPSPGALNGAAHAVPAGPPVPAGPAGPAIHPGPPPAPRPSGPPPSLVYPPPPGQADTAEQQGPVKPVARRSIAEVLGADSFHTVCVLGGLAALCCVAAVSPGGALMCVIGALTGLRTVDRNASRLAARRNAFGPRRGDVAVTALATPWRATVSLLVTVLALLVPLLIAACVWFLGRMAVGTAGISLDTLAYSSSPVSGISLAVLLMLAWWGPGGGALRRGARITTRAVARRRRLSGAVLVGLGLTVLAALLVAGRQVG